MTNAVPPNSGLLSRITVPCQTLTFGGFLLPPPWQFIGGHGKLTIRLGGRADGGYGRQAGDGHRRGGGCNGVCRLQRRTGLCHADSTRDRALYARATADHDFLGASR